MYSSIPFGLEGGMWDLIVLIPDHCHSKEGRLYFFTPGIRSIEVHTLSFPLFRKILFACYFIYTFSSS